MPQEAARGRPPHLTPPLFFTIQFCNSSKQGKRRTKLNCPINQHFCNLTTHFYQGLFVSLNHSLRKSNLCQPRPRGDLICTTAKSRGVLITSKIIVSCSLYVIHYSCVSACIRYGSRLSRKFYNFCPFCFK
jgi:hypothetical protein